MTKKTDVLIQQLSIECILNFEYIKMPIFQRRYSWGTKNDDKKEKKALYYFEDFLMNKSNNSFFGNLFIHSNSRYDYNKDKNIIVYLSDGQHRLITLVMASFAFFKELEQIDENDLDLDELDEKKSIMSSSIFQKFNNHLECIVDSGKSEELINFIQNKINELDTLNKDIQTAKDLYQTHLLDKKNDKKSLKNDLNNSLKNLNQKINDIESNPIYHSYFLISSSIKSKPTTLLRQASKFVDRVNSLRAGVISLQPEQGEKPDDTTIESEAFAMFTQMNGEAIPLTAGELFTSFVNEKLNKSELNKYFTKNTKEYNTIYFFNLIEKNNMVDFLQRIYLSKDPVNLSYKDPYSWVKFLYNNNNENQINTIKNYLNSLILAKDSIEQSSDDIKYLFEIYLELQNSLPITIFISKNFEKNKIKNSTELRKLLKILILINIMITFIPKSGKRPNLSRDLPNKNGDEESALEYIRSHFDVKNNLDLKKSVEQHLATFKLGQVKFRKLSKILLIIPDVDNWGNQHINRIKDFDYEHVFPSKYKYDESNFDNQIITPKNLKDEFDELFEDENFDTIVNLIGNGALLNSKSNKSLKNKSPYIKFEKLNGTNNHINSWWPSHVASLNQHKGKWDIIQIQNRSVDLAKQITDWLFKELI